jgi:hypothetical protein
LKPVQANSSPDPIWKNLTHTHTHKRAGRRAQGIYPEFKAQYHKREKKIKLKSDIVNHTFNPSYLGGGD